MTYHLKESDKNQIGQWIGGRLKYSLLYKASTDGCSATAFHGKCDNIGPTVTVLYNTNKSVYGGYTSLNWDSSGTYKNDSKAFLFRLYQNGNWNPVQMKVNNSKKAIFCKASYGPTFGGGIIHHDLKTFTGTINSNDLYYPLDGYAKLGTSYTMNGEDYNSIANGHLNVEDIEVYLAQALPADEPLAEPWRKMAEWNMELMNELKKKIEKYEPKMGLNVREARLLLIGQVEAGKSSFYETLNTIFRGRITGQAAKGTAAHSITLTYGMRKIRKGFSEPLKFRIHDTKGLESDQGLDSHQICYILDGHVPNKYQFNDSVPITPNIQGFVKYPSLSDKIHCVVFVVDGGTAAVMSGKVLEKIRNIQTEISVREIPQVVLLTKIDKICALTQKDMSKVFYSSFIYQTVDQVAQMMGLPKSHILPIKNYEQEMELNYHIDILALLSLQRMLDFADDFMCNHFDQLEDEQLQSQNSEA